MKTKKLILTLTRGRNFLFITVNRQKPQNLTVSRPNRQNLTVNRQSYTPIETLFQGHVACRIRT